MNNGQVNERILKKIKNNNNDKIINDFLIELLFEESEHSGQWWHHKECYKEKIKSSSEIWSDDDEN